MTTSVMRTAAHHGWRQAALESFVVLGVLLWLFTEALGAVRAITFPALAGAWGTTSLVLAGLAWKRSGKSMRDAISKEGADLRRIWKTSARGDIAALIYMGLSALILALIAMTAAPNTWDSLTYHLSRVMHWQQNRTLDFYPTAIQRQLAFGPLAEMGVLNLQILAGSDRLANFVQYFAMAGCAIGVSLLARRLGGQPRAQLFAALAAMTLPMGVLQATSTQNDYVAALWCVCFTALVLAQMQQEPSTRLSLLAGAALGLAILTKATAMLFAASFGIWFALSAVRRLKLRAFWPLTNVLGAAIIITCPYSIRNYELYGNPLGMSSGPELAGYTNVIHSPPVLASNLLRNLGSQLSSPFGGLNDTIEMLIDKAHRVIGIDVNDPRTSWHKEHFQLIFTTHEDSAVNPLDAIMILVSGALLLCFKDSKTIKYGMSLAAAFMIFSYVLKWQPWQSRLLLTLFVLAMPLVAVVLSRYLPGRQLYVVELLLAAAAVPYLVSNPTRPLVGTNSILLRDRISQYFTYAADHAAPYAQAAETTRDLNCERIGLITDVESPEYLMWATMRVYNSQARLEDILVRNVSRSLRSDTSPCAIIILDPIRAPVQMDFQNRLYIREMDTKRLSLFVMSNPSP
jgi:hypothetical protein